jgi:hypothetical protein
MSWAAAERFLLCGVDITATIQRGERFSSIFSVKGACTDSSAAIQFNEVAVRLCALPNEKHEISSGNAGRKSFENVKLHKVKVSPAHPTCRCVLVPYIGDGGVRPAEAENFDMLAEQMHGANPKVQKNYEELSYEYRRKLRYAAMEEYRQKTGKYPYRQVSGDMNFADYLKGQSATFQREWLGKTRYDLYKSGKLTLEQMVNPDRGFKRTIAELKAMVNMS